MEEKVSKLLNSFGGIPSQMPPEAVDCIREYFCSGDTDIDEDNSDIDEPEPVASSSSDISPTASSSAVAYVTTVGPTAMFDQPLISTSIPVEDRSRLDTEMQCAVECFSVHSVGKIRTHTNFIVHYISHTVIVCG